MSRVVLRCPHCGTTRGSPGECEACHEAQVRYYCTNHTPGRWLDAPACTQCGARFGEAARPPAWSPETTATRPRPAPRAAPVPAPPSPRYAPPRRPGGGAAPPRPYRAPPATDDDLDPRDERRTGASGWEEMLRAAARARHEHAEALRRAEEMRGMERAPPRRGAGGCLLRIVLLLVFLFLAMFSGVFLFVGQLFSPF